MYRDECSVEYDTTCHQELSHSFTIRGYEPQKMKRDLKETLVPVTQGKVVVTYIERLLVKLTEYKTMILICRLLSSSEAGVSQGPWC